MTEARADLRTGWSGTLQKLSFVPAVERRLHPLLVIFGLATGAEVYGLPVGEIERILRKA